VETRTGDPRLKLLLDEHISGKVADRLNRRGHDVVAASAEFSLRGLSDPDLFEAAQDQGRIVVTYNSGDFEEILRGYAAYGKEHHGLVLVQHRCFPGQDLGRLANALEKLGPPAGGSFLLWLQA
jgi:predicted nuclease of predicted toxin-antitoxin system